MITPFRLKFLHLLILILLTISSTAKGSNDFFTVTADNQQAYLYSDTTYWKGVVWFTHIEMQQPGTINVRTTDDIQSLEFLPVNDNYSYELTSPRTIRITAHTLDQQITLVVNGNPMSGNVLHLFLNDDDDDNDNVDAGYHYDANTRTHHFGSGHHNLQQLFGTPRLTITKDEQIHLADDAIVEGMLTIENGDHARIYGHGMVINDKNGTIHVNNSKDCTVEGITTNGRCWHAWQVVVTNSERVHLSKLKIINTHYASTDGIDIVSSSHCTIDSCFVRACDDAIAIKGLGNLPPSQQPAITHIDIHNVQLWNDCNNAFGIGAETRAREFSNITLSNADILFSYDDPQYHTQLDERAALNICSLHGTHFHDILFDDIRIYHCQRLIGLGFKPSFWFGSIQGDQQGEGSIHHVTFRNIISNSPTDSPIANDVLLYEWNESGTPHKPIHHITFDNVFINKLPLTPDSPCLHTNSSEDRQLIFTSSSEQMEQNLLTLSPLFTDNMVLQQHTNAPIWGTTTPNTTVSIHPSWRKKPVTTKSDHNGHFLAHIATPKAGGPHHITITTPRTTITLQNVMTGEVWLCSGQSNMDMPIQGWGEVFDAQQEIANANHPNIRLLHVANTMSPQPQKQFCASNGAWQLCTPETIAPFSATAYFFGRHIAAIENVPVGLIQASWGGTPAEAWISTTSLKETPHFREAALRIEQMPEDIAERTLFHQNELAQWDQLLSTIDTLTPNKVDDSTLTTTQQPGYLLTPPFDTFDGIIWCYKQLSIPQHWLHKPLQLNLGQIDDNDVTFFNGNIIGRTDGYAEERNYNIPDTLVCDTLITISIRILDIGGWAGLLGNKQGNISLHCEKEEIILNGEWKVATTLPLSQVPTSPRNPLTDAKNASMLYNAMIAPLAPYAMQGVVWYQGEDNANRAHQYQQLLPLLIRDWRQQWQQKLHFCIAELANYTPVLQQPAQSKWAELREAQQLTAHNDKHCSIATLIDIGTADDIHPRNKQATGQRLALAALAKVYKNKCEYTGPTLRHYRIKGNTIVLTFDHCRGGLTTSDNEPVRGFAIAGADQQFYWASAEIQGNKIILHSDQVQHPVAVRYAWADNPDCNLCSREKLPAPPFRTDKWHGITYGNTQY